MPWVRCRWIKLRSARCHRKAELISTIHHRARRRHIVRRRAKHECEGSSRGKLHDAAPTTSTAARYSVKICFPRTAACGVCNSTIDRGGRHTRLIPTTQTLQVEACDFDLDPSRWKRSREL